MQFAKSLLATAGALLVATGAHAQGVMKNDPKRPVADIARDLGITADEFVACFDNVSPAPAGTKASGEREMANKAILLPCLQQANPAITNDRLDAVMDRYRPEGRVAG